jgi:D-alanyl-D-alanine carboxypeptidase/D-alanyl-D-alanine-endopeptidase (penicillin-binding protein 4)
MVKSTRERITTSLQFLFIVVLISLTTSCSVQKAQKALLSSNSLKGAHVGIAVYNESNQQWVSKFQSDHYFTPASNTKIQSCFLGMKYLKDSVAGWQYAENSDTVFLMPLGDPSFLHPDFKYQPVADLIKNTKKQIVFCLPDAEDKFEAYGRGWAWDDYPEDYQPERNRLNIYGNVMTVYKKANGIQVKPSFFTKNQTLPAKYTLWSREKLSNQFFPKQDLIKDIEHQVPFITGTNYNIAKSLIEDSLHPYYSIAIQKGWNQPSTKFINTVATDSLLKIMMNRSDNFFAEQILLMTSQQLLGRMDDAAIIDTILKTDFSDFPQKPEWADGSGLSRFNLTTPENYITLLQKMEKDFSMERIKSIFAQGGKGTLSSYYKNIPGVLYAKTGTLGNQIALSGYIITNKGTRLTFSVLVGNHVSPSTYPVRHAVEEYLTAIMKKY